MKYQTDEITLLKAEIENLKLEVSKLKLDLAKLKAATTRNRIETCEKTAASNHRDKQRQKETEEKIKKEVEYKTLCNLRNAGRF